jgi:hypothetical protein
MSAGSDCAAIYPPGLGIFSAGGKSRSLPMGSIEGFYFADSSPITYHCNAVEYGTCPIPNSRSTRPTSQVTDCCITTAGSVWMDRLDLRPGTHPLACGARIDPYQLA